MLISRRRIGHSGAASSSLIDKIPGPTVRSSLANAEKTCDMSCREWPSVQRHRL